MADSLEYQVFLAATVTLGVIGLFAITLLPLRAYLALREHYPLLRGSPGQVFVYSLLAAVSASSLVPCIRLAYKLARCLLGFNCGANAAAGWLLLCYIGLIYLFFELVRFLIIRVAASGSQAAT